jgi:uncharacterized protein
VRKTPAGPRFSATDLVNFAACRHLSHLDLVHLDTPLPKAADTEELRLIAGKGDEHEKAYWEQLRSGLSSVADLSAAGADDQSQYEGSLEAMRQGAEALYQATLLDGSWMGHADFLLRVPTPSVLGDFSYEVVDTKLARRGQAKFLIQLCLYSELLGVAQGTRPRYMHVVLGTGRRVTYRVDDYLRYFRRIRDRFLGWVTASRVESYPERVDRCAICHWRDLCSQRWQQDDHLNQVANITRTQCDKLRAAGVSTVAALAGVDSARPVPKMQPETVARLSHQARLQVQSRSTGLPVYEVLPVAPGQGFDRLPPADPGDLYFDMEGDPHHPDGLEYLFGVGVVDAGGLVFTPFWGHTREEERQAFEAFIDFVTAHLSRHPKAHIYHYAHYEPTAIKRLMSFHATREQEVDDLLRQQRFVDLYSVVRGGVRVGEDSYSIKSLERIYRPAARGGDVTTAGASVVFYERWRESGDPSLLKAIEDYNRDDVESTWALSVWLRSIEPPRAASASSADLQPEPTAPSAAANEKAITLEAYRQRLTAGLPVDRADWQGHHRVAELIFQLLGFHRRADKPAWWAMFDRQTATPEELLENLEVIAGMEWVGKPVDARGSRAYRYRYPEQEFKLKTGDGATVVETLKSIRQIGIDEQAREVTFSTRTTAPIFPATNFAIGTSGPLNTGVIQEALQWVAEVHLTGRSGCEAALSFLARKLPVVRGVTAGTPLLAAGEDPVAGTSRVVQGLDASYLFIQGPPGAGKTYTGSHVIVDLLQAGKRVAVSSNSHKAINNLLRAVEAVAMERGFTFIGGKKSSSDDTRLDGQFIRDCKKNRDIFDYLGSMTLVAGTAWLLSSEEVRGQFDYVFVDEAGQVSLANLIAMSTCAKNLVLLGDQMQLGQPIQGVHPGESGLSALEYLLQGRATVPPESGVFLKDSWRMHPDVCQFISDAVYDGRLQAEPRNANQRLVLRPEPPQGVKATGISFINCLHDGCSQRSDEEAEVIAQTVRYLLTCSYVDRQGQERPMELSNILVVAPYNLQVNRLKQVLPAGARVGTVDKFQGQEAEAVLVSMTTSSGEYLPRNIEFLYSRNRLNVAISRARCWAGVVASPKLLDIDVNTVEEMGLVSTLCWVKEYSEPK